MAVSSRSDGGKEPPATHSTQNPSSYDSHSYRLLADVAYTQRAGFEAGKGKKLCIKSRSKGTAQRRAA